MNPYDSPAEWLRLKLFQLREALVRWLEKKEKKLSPARKKLYLLLFLLIFGGYSTWCLVSGIRGQGASAIQVSPLKRPLVEHYHSREQKQARKDSIKNLK